MATHIEAHDIGDAWLQAAHALVDAPGRTLVNLAVSIADPLHEDVGVRRELEATLAELAYDNGRKSKGSVHSVHTVANTIFPISLYNPAHEQSAEMFFQRARDVSRLHHHGHHNEWGTYFGRLVAYPNPGGGEVNQLEKFLTVLDEDKKWADRYEAPLTLPGETTDPIAADALVIGPQDRRARGGPCLAHLSFTVLDDALHLTALYRRHHYLARAYGNFLGLARLQHFLATESGRDVGGMLVVGTHAKLEDGTVAHNKNLVERASRVQGDVRPIEVSTRGLGVGWRDLELPTPDQKITSR